ncbi:hypothetical protein SNEBB_002724 [Seison nebaliae]|nr:hypothetical protein SNEBB_002724 [Seison nebaliae]
MFSVAELFCGMGGMSAALEQTNLNYEIKIACDISPNAINTYRYNSLDVDISKSTTTTTTLSKKSKLNGTEIIEKCIESIPIGKFLDVDLVLASPPCQPFTRQGKKLDEKDHRSKGFLFLIDSFQLIPPRNLPKFILIENVVNFEKSTVHRRFIDLLKEKNFEFVQLILSPTFFFVPNSRPRYYCLARQKREKIESITSEEVFDGTSFLHFEKKLIKYEKDETKKIRNIWRKHFGSLERNVSSLQFHEVDEDDEIRSFIVEGMLDEEWMRKDGGKRRLVKIQNYLSKTISENRIDNEEEKIRKCSSSINLVSGQETTSHCFTKNYGSYLKGTGSILKMEKSFRFFDVSEILRILGYNTQRTTFPKEMKLKTSIGLLGNSINVPVVSTLISILTSSVSFTYFLPPTNETIKSS